MNCSLGVREKIRTALRLRLEMNIPYMSRWHEVCSAFAVLAAEFVLQNTGHGVGRAATESARDAAAHFADGRRDLARRRGQGN